MSGLQPPRHISTLPRAAVPSTLLPRRVHPRKRTHWRRAVTSALGHNQTHAPRQKTYSITVGAAYFGADWSFLRIFAGWRWTAPRLLNGRNSVFSERNQLANLTRVLRFGGRLVTSSAPGIGEREEQKRVGSDRRRNSLSERGGSRSCGLRPQ